MFFEQLHRVKRRSRSRMRTLTANAAFLTLALAFRVANASPGGFETPTPIPVRADDLHPLGFSQLVLNIREVPEIKVSGDSTRIKVLEALRQGGYNVVGQENLVFGEDRRHGARFLLGGTVTELECVDQGQSRTAASPSSGSCETNSSSESRTKRWPANMSSE